MCLEVPLIDEEAEHIGSVYNEQEERLKQILSIKVVLENVVVPEPTIGDQFVVHRDEFAGGHRHDAARRHKVSIFVDVLHLAMGQLLDSDCGLQSGQSLFQLPEADAVSAVIPNVALFDLRFALKTPSVDRQPMLAVHSIDRIIAQRIESQCGPSTAHLPQRRFVCSRI